MTPPADRPSRWTRTARALHWGTALAILVEVPAGFIMAYTYADRDGTLAGVHLRSSQIHHTLGMILLLTVTFRLVWRMTHRAPPLPGDVPPATALLARITQALLYLMLFILPLSGWATVSALGAGAGFPAAEMWFFTQDGFGPDGFIPRIVPPVPVNADTIVSFGTFARIHVWALMLGAGLLLHIGGALYHHFIRRDRVLARMLSRFGRMTASLPVRRAYVDSRYGQLHYRSAGSRDGATAPPLLCLHQTPSSSLEWEPLLPFLGERRLVVAVDTPGYGMSDGPSAPAGADDFAAVMQGVADDLFGSGPFDIMGMHTGAVIAAVMADRWPDRVRRVVMMGLPIFPAEDRAPFVAGVATRFPPADASLTRVRKLWDFFATFGDARVDDEMRMMTVAQRLTAGPRMAWGYSAAFGPDFGALLDRIEQPVLVLNPEDDLWDVTREGSARLKRGRRWDLPGRGQGFMPFEAESLSAGIAAFLDKAQD